MRHQLKGIPHHVSRMESRGNRITGDACDRDWIWEREIETASADDSFRLATGAWERQFRRLRESSPFYARKFREAGLGSSFVGLSDLKNVPFTTKEEFKTALDEDPPFGSNLCVEPNLVKRVYQTSGTSGTPNILALTRADMETWTVMGTRTYYATGIHEHSLSLIHISEPTRLGMISYAVFCLKKKKKK